MTLAGIDISSYQNPTPPLGGLAFLFAKTTEGTLKDPMYDTHIANGRKAGLYVGAYHFNYAPLSVATQVASFLAKAGNVDLYALDFEGKYIFTRAQATEFISRMHAAGKKCGLYASTSVFFDAGQDFDWVADYRAAYQVSGPPIHWDFWQKSGSGVDRDVFKGDAAALAHLIGGPSAGPIGVDMTLAPVTDYEPRLMDLPAGESEFLEDCVTPSGRLTTGGAGLPTPFGCTRKDGVKFRAYVISYSTGVWAFRFAASTKVYDLPAAPATDCTAAVKAATAPLTAKAAASDANLKATTDALAAANANLATVNAKIIKARADLA